MVSPRILIAGIGNIFLGDDAFGVAVVRQLAGRPWPSGVTVKDFGIRGFDLACALQEGYDAVILVDTIQRGSIPGTLHVLEPDRNSPGPDATEPHLEMHHLDPVQVFQLARRIGGRLPCLRLVGCEPATLEPAEEEAGSLSQSVLLAVPKAVELVQELVADLLANRSGQSEAGNAIREDRG
jgi:hydrogenase maturation protease